VLTIRFDAVVDAAAPNCFFVVLCFVWLTVFIDPSTKKCKVQFIKL